MKIKSSKLFALLLAVVLVFGSVAVAASAANTDPYVKVSTIENATLGAKKQQITISLSTDTELVNAKLVLAGDAKSLDKVSIVANDKVEGISVSQTNGSVTLSVTKATNESTTDELVLATVSFDFQAGAKGAVVLTPTTSKVDDTQPATIAGAEWGVTKVIGDKGETYKDMVGIGLKDYIKTSSTNAPVVEAKIVVTLVPLDGSGFVNVGTIEVPVTTAIHGQKGMTASEVAAFLKTEEAAALITEAIQEKSGNEKFTAADFDVQTTTVKLNDKAVPTSYTYDEDEEYVYSVSLKQLAKTEATIKVVFRSAFADKSLYHSSDIADFNITMSANAGATIFSQATVLTYVKQHFDLYDQRNGDLDMDNDGIDDISIDGYYLNQWVKDQSAGQYDLADFVLDESVVAFNNAKISGSEKFSADPAQNVYTVYLDQVNVPKSVLMAAAEAFGKIDYGQFADAYVLTINETIEAFQAFCDSLVNAEWPSAEDVEEEEDKDSSDSPKTGAFIGLGSALAVVAALSATAVAIVRKKED